MTYFIPLTQGKAAFIDDEDAALLRPYKWRLNSKGYAISSTYDHGKEHVFNMHRLIVNAQRGEYVDHINNLRHDNHKANLRICTASQNLANRGLFRNSTTGFMGVTFDNDRWRAHIQIDERILFLGVYDDLLTAAQVRDHAARQLYGEFARPNLPDQPVDLVLRRMVEQRLLSYGYRFAITE